MPSAAMHRTRDDAGGSASQSGAGATGGAAGTAGSGRDGGSGSGASGAGGAAGDSGTGGSMPSTDGGPEAGLAGTGGDAGDAGSSGSGGACESCPSHAPHCMDDSCVECTDDDHCPGGVCEQNACVPCRTDNDCHDVAAARCSNELQCVACRASSDCEHLPDAPVCNAGTCVECTATRYNCGADTSGTPRVCNSLTYTCATEIEHSAGLCDPCVSDAQCKPGQLCVMQTYDAPTDSPDAGELEVGHFCFWRKDSTELSAPAGSCVSVRPYVETRADVTSIDGVQATVCGLRVTTCAGYKDYSTKSCAGTNDDGACGDSRFADDGYCEPFDTGHRCTTPCLSDDDCDVGTSCNGGPPKFCSLQ